MPDDAAERLRGRVVDPTRDRRLKVNKHLPPTERPLDRQVRGMGRVKDPTRDRRLKQNR
jgi:hypothetical protein